jgi:hypothetical protein
MKGTEMGTSKRILRFGLLALFSVALLAGCARKTPEQPQADSLVLEPLVGLGPIRFGMSEEEVIEHFGPPDRVFTGQVTKLNYVPSRGLSFVMDPERGLQEICCWSEGMLPSRVTTFAGRTKAGIGIGATQEDIIAAYGRPDRTSTDSKGVTQNLHYDRLKARFSLRDGALVSMVFGVPK